MHRTHLARALAAALTLAGAALSLSLSLSVAVSVAVSAAEPSAPAQVLAQNPEGGVRLQLSGPQLQALDAQGRVLRSWPVPAGVLPVLVHAARQSFVIVPRERPELWELSWDPGAAPIFDGLVHDYRMGEALPRPGYLGLRRSPLRSPLTAVCPCGAQPYLRVWEADRSDSAVLHLDVRRVIAQCPALQAPTGSGGEPAASHPGCGCPACPPR